MEYRDESTYEFPVHTRDTNKVISILKEINKEYPHLDIRMNKTPQRVDVSITLKKNETGPVEGIEVHERLTERLFQED